MEQKLFDSHLFSWLIQKNDPMLDVNFLDYYIPLKTKKETKTTHCIIVFAAVDETGKTVTVPEWTPQTEEEKSLQRYAIRLSDMRKQISEEMKSYFTE